MHAAGKDRRKAGQNSGILTVHLEAGFADLGRNSGPTEINGKTSMGQNFTPGN